MRPLRFGVEEEYLLVDARTRTTVPRAPSVLRDVSRVLGNRAQAEFYATQIEGCTPPVRTAAELRAHLLAVRAALTAAAARAGCLLVASGSAVLPSAHPLPVTDAPRYRRIAGHVGPGVADQAGGEVCGCHVHVGDLTRGEALAVSTRLGPWLPVVQALGANSPFCEGADRGGASSRAAHYERWPTVGPAPSLDETGYERYVERLVADGTVVDRRMIYWYARPSEHLPTLEVRIADVNADVGVPVLIAVLLRGLTRVLLAETDRPCPPVGERLLRAAHRRAAAAGLHGTALDVRGGDDAPRAAPVSVLLDELLERAAPGLAAEGDLDLARRLCARLLAGGAGADAQRAAFARRGLLPDVVDALAALTSGGGTSGGRTPGGGTEPE